MYKRIKDLPIGTWFWRKKNLLKWSMGGTFLMGVGESDVVTEELSDPEEIVLVNPTLCYNCLEGLPGWPPPTVCPYCGFESPEKSNFEGLQQTISEWTGIAKPHI